MDTRRGGVDQHPHIGGRAGEKFRAKAHDVEPVDARAGELPEKGAQQPRVEFALRRPAEQVPELIVVIIWAEIQRLRGAFEIGSEMIPVEGPAGMGDPGPNSIIDGVEGGGLARPGRARSAEHAAAYAISLRFI